jgi:TonB family protein
MLNPHLDRGALSPRALLITALLAACATVSAAAVRVQQTAPLTLKGTVYDPSGAVLPEVAMTLENAQHAKLDATTDAAGAFEFTLVAPGTYVLEAALPGFKALRQTLDLKTARDWDRAITLQVGELQESIMVTTPRRTGGAVAAGAPERVRVGGNIRAPRKVRDVRPVYPAAMRDAGREGVVPLEAIIDRDGSVTSLRVVSAQVHPDFAIAAMEAVRQWQFTPTLLNGEPVEVVMNVSISFKLSE